MPGLSIRFPAGRYHATPWGHHVNEGQVEWPPSPWRILRTLIAVGFNTQNWATVPETAERLVSKLADSLPAYVLPAVSVAHSRHYMPLGTLDKGREKTTLVYDTWLNVGSNDTLEVHWDVILTEPELIQFRLLAANLNYLGRGESWVDANIIEDSSLSATRYNAIPHEVQALPGPGWEQISLMAAIPSGQYSAWRAETTECLLARLPLPEGKKPPARLLKEREKAISPYPASLLDCLTKDTDWWKDQGWAQPPGAQRVLYWRPGGAVQVGAPSAPRKVASAPVTAVLLAITTPSGNKSSLPPVARTLPQAELLHSAIVSVLGKGLAVDCPEITGRDAAGQPLKAQHRHAHIFPLDLDLDHRLDHFLIYAPMGLGSDAQQAIRAVRRTWTKGGKGDLQLALAASGDPELLRTLAAPTSQGLGQLLGPSDGACVWVSHTPFVPPRFLKQRGANTLEGQVQAELASRGLPAAAEVTLLPDAPRARSLRHFVRIRRRGGLVPPVDVGYVLQLRFADPMHGPFSLGYASHFGLGLFTAA